MEEEQHEEIIRVRMPRNAEVFGVVDKLLGSARMYVKCSDSKMRLCRVPGSLKRAMWVKLNDVVIVRPWEVEGNEKGDIIHTYQRSQVDWLRRNGHLKTLEENF